MPIKTKNRPAPEKLLSIIRCNCKTNCETRRCSCRKHGLECNISCGECRGQNCLNSKSVEMGVESEELISDQVEITVFEIVLVLLKTTIHLTNACVGNLYLTIYVSKIYFNI